MTFAKTMSRRQIIKSGLALSAFSTAIFSGVIKAEWPKMAYEQKTFNNALEKLFGNTAISDSNDIVLKAPEIAENGAVVPIRVKTKLDGVKSISLFVEKNPNPLVARFKFSPGLPGEINTRIKLAEKSNVIAVVETEHGLFRKTQFVKVTRGGCGG